MTFSKWELTEGTSFKTAKSGLSKSDLDFITRFALWLEEIENWEGDSQSPGMYASYKNQVMQYVHYLLHPVMEKETGLTLLPTYTYFRVYRNGAILDKHKDRPACEVSATMLLGANYSPTWPVITEGESVVQEAGDVLIYRGCDVEHWREPFVTEEGNYHVQIFAHYVDANGPYFMCAGDQQRIEPPPTQGDIDSGLIPLS